jgi:Raf kinase inhibitor-like YbhB/YbcL family protein
MTLSKELSKQVAKLAGRALRPARSGDDKLAKARKRTRTPEIRVTAGSFPHGGRIPDRHAGEAGLAPELRWTGVPADAKEVAILCEDPDAPMPRPFVHWVLYGLAPSLSSLPEGIAPGTALADGAVQGENSLGKKGFTGPKPPRGHGVHHYHFQVFALDALLPLGTAADRDALVEAMRGHVIASGEVVGAYENN